MPARNKHFRALNAEFRLHLDLRTAWPVVKKILAILKTQGGGKKTDVAAMKAGELVPSKYVTALVQALWTDAVLKDYLATKGILRHEQELSVDQVSDHLAGPTQDHPGTSQEASDWFIGGIDTIGGAFVDYVWSPLTRHGSFCNTEKDVETASTMMFASLGRELHKHGASLEDAEAIKVAEDWIRIGMDHYVSRLIEIWRQLPWSVMFAVVDRQRVGASVVLPLQEPIYNDVCRGRNPHSYSVSALSPKSRTLIIEGLGFRSDKDFPNVSRKTLQTLRSMFLQIAYLSMVERPGIDDSLEGPRIITIGGTPRNVKRAKSLGFRPTGDTLRGFDVEVLELDIRKAWLLSFITLKLQQRLREGGILGR